MNLTPSRGAGLGILLVVALSAALPAEQSATGAGRKSGGPQPSSRQSTVRAAEGTARAGDESAAVIFNGEQDGFLAPCGCSSPQTGGMPRLGSFVRPIASAQPLLRVQNGDLVTSVTRQDQLKSETMVDILDSLGYQAINLGEKDFDLGLPYLQSLQQRFHGSFLCGNVKTVKGSSPFPAQTVVVVQHAGRGEKIEVVGLLSAQFSEGVQASNPDLRLEAPGEVLSRIAPAIRQAAAVRILLYHGPLAEGRILAKQFPLFQLMVCAHEGDHPSPVEHAGGSVLVCSGQDGKDIGVARLRGGAVQSVSFTSLGPQFPDDPAVAALKRVYLQRVVAEDLMSQIPRAPTENGDTFAGSAACAPCHREAYQTWLKSGHSQGLATLAHVGEDHDPECVLCHTVGLDRLSGFVSAETTPQLAGVGCESCHGPAARHVQDPHVKLSTVTEDACLKCHTTEQSPNFDFARYWPRIAH